jgi:hypothetical protein
MTVHLYHTNVAPIHIGIRLIKNDHIWNNIEWQNDKLIHIFPVTPFDIHNTWKNKIRSDNKLRRKKKKNYNNGVLLRDEICSMANPHK